VPGGRNPEEAVMVDSDQDEGDGDADGDIIAIDASYVVFAIAMMNEDTAKRA
jgi:hypothetical protein